MALSRDNFDPLGVVVDWLDACRSGQLDTLLDLYDEQATLVCDCEHVSLTGRLSIASYWKSKLESKSASAFALDDIALIGDAVQVDYQSDGGKPIRIRFRFSPLGKILQTSCEPLATCTI
ncbi:nuclear transport factor 2 family protein [Bradyrhizobium sp. Ai1a-2]|uniref:nuclear transport factor 2 family protein n=1 Tax=Bradyrhizobium sp. Ai1a-2 TaxID=196490 RepID=UPI0005B784B5|nr:nuclear transport factor 2 family protein [Bradyrhizobium sp. Ai1a-2]